MDSGVTITGKTSRDLRHLDYYLVCIYLVFFDQDEC